MSNSYICIKCNTITLTVMNSLIDTCIKELLLIRYIINEKVSDDFSSRLIAVYAMIRVDDITKIWGHTIPKTDPLRSEYDKILTAYNCSLRSVRDKLGAHYQSTSDSVDLLGSTHLFHSIDYANTICLIEDIISFEEKKCSKQIDRKGFLYESDFSLVKSVMRQLFSDDQSVLSNGVLDIFGINKCSLISCTPAQAKGQYLRSLEMMVNTSYQLLMPSYCDVSISRMFKRLFVCMTYNYHDNLCTRKINVNTVQYEEGFDILFKTLITNNDDKSKLENAFEKFEQIYHVNDYFEKHRKVRDHACAHFDEKSDILSIDKELDTIVVDDLYKNYSNMVNMFNYICNNVFTLQAISLPSRSHMHNENVELTTDTENFYGDRIESPSRKDLDCVAILRSIRKMDDNQEESKALLNQILQSGSGTSYQSMMNEITNRLKESDIPSEELTAILSAMIDARRGFPDRIQRAVFALLSDDDIFNNHSGHLLFVISNICCDDKDIDVQSILQSIINQKLLVPSSLTVLAYLHLIMDRIKPDYSKRSPHELDTLFVSFCQIFNRPTDSCGLMLMLAQRWFYDTEYAHYKKLETKYSEYLIKQSETALLNYFHYIKLSDKEEKQLCLSYLKNQLYILLLYRLALLEKGRNQNDNVFLNLWKYNCFYRTRYQMYEAFGVGLMTELSGDVSTARLIFESLAKEYPINDDAIQTLELFRQRHPN